MGYSYKVLQLLQELNREKVEAEKKEEERQRKRREDERIKGEERVGWEVEKIRDDEERRRWERTHKLFMMEDKRQKEKKARDKDNHLC